MSRGPNRATLADLAEVLDDDELFATTPDGWRQLRVARGRLAEVLELSRSALHYRLRSLVEAGVARTDVTVAFDPARLAGPLTPESAPTPSPADLLDDTVDRWRSVLVQAARSGDVAAQNRALRVIHSLAEVDLSRDLSRDKSAVCESLSRDAVAVWSRDSSDLETERETEIDLSSLSSSSVPLSRDTNRDADLSRDRPEKATTGGEPGVPAADRDFGDEETDWVPAMVREILEPLQAACERTDCRPVEVPARLLTAMRAWPIRWLERAVAGIAVDVDARRVTSPGGILYRAVVEGRLRYFPLEPSDAGPSPWDDSVSKPAPVDPLVEAAETIACNRRRGDLKTMVAKLLDVCGTDPPVERVAVAAKVALAQLQYYEVGDYSEVLALELDRRYGWSYTLDSLLGLLTEGAA